MALTLSKGSNLSLDKAEPGLKKVLIGLGWDPRVTDGKEFDLDASAFLLGANGKVRSDNDFIFYNQMKSACGSVVHTGDNRTGEGEGDDEQLIVDLSLIPADIEKVAFTVTIHDADLRKQNFGQVGGAFIRIENAETAAARAAAEPNVDHSLARFDLQEDYSTETAMIFAELYRHGGEWKFRAIGQGYAGGLQAMANNYGISL